MSVVLMIGAPSALAQQNWTTYYNPDYIFAFDYPDNTTKITNSRNDVFSLIQQIESPITSIAVFIQLSNIDPQEVALKDTLSLPDSDIMSVDGIVPMVIDDKNSYSFTVIDDDWATLKTRIHLNHNGYLYSFIIIGLPNSFDTSGRDKMIESIKFF